MRAAAYVRYHSGDGFGHVGWAFDWSAGSVNAGAVENHSGAFDTPVSQMGFWTDFSSDPTPRMRELLYDDVKFVDVDDANPIAAYRVVLWIKRQPFRAIHRNCLDDTYDVLRAFGVRNMDAPSRDLIPNEWFKRFRGTLAHTSEYRWHDAQMPAAAVDPPEANSLPPLYPQWRRPWHPQFHLLNLQKLLRR